MTSKHRHRPTDDRIRGHGRFDYQCAVCGRWILFVAATENRQAYWRTF